MEISSILHEYLRVVLRISLSWKIYDKSDKYYKQQLCLLYKQIPLCLLVVPSVVYGITDGIYKHSYNITNKSVFPRD